MRLNRRALVGGLASLAATHSWADDKSSPIATGILAANSLAQNFEAVTTRLPDVDVWGPKGTQDISELKGKTILMPLWAEWCAPCMSELPDFARLQQKYGNDKFAIIPILTDTKKKFTPELLSAIFRSMHCEVFEPLIENHLGSRLMQSMAQIKQNQTALPCNLLLAPDGHVVAREMGRIANSDDATPAKTYAETLARVDADAVQSRWGQADGDQFAKAMAEGFLT
jgi:thiol-disulfide isomerase/thioredoxin